MGRRTVCFLIELRWMACLLLMLPLVTLAAHCVYTVQLDVNIGLGLLILRWVAACLNAWILLYLSLHSGLVVRGFGCLFERFLSW